MEQQIRHNSNSTFIDMTGTSEKIINSCKASSMLSTPLLFHPLQSSTLFSNNNNNNVNNGADENWCLTVDLTSNSDADSVKSVEEINIDKKFESLSVSSTTQRKYKFANLLTIGYKNSNWSSFKYVISCMNYFKNNINPVSLEIGIEHMKELSIDKIIVQTQTEKDLEILAKHLENHETLFASKNTENLSISMILDCRCCSITRSTFLHALVKQNRENFFKAVNYASFTYRDNCIVSRQCVLVKVLSYRKLYRGSFIDNVVIEIAPILWSLFYKSKLNLGFGQMTARPLFLTRQCRRCLKYGDRRQHCTATLVCNKCFGNHSSSVCRRPFCGYCYPCWLDNQKNACNYNIYHELKDNKCPSYIKMVMLEIEAMNISDKDKKIVLSDYRAKLTKYGNCTNFL